MKKGRSEIEGGIWKQQKKIRQTRKSFKERKVKRKTKSDNFEKRKRW